MIWYQPLSAGPVRYLLIDHLWTGPRLSARDRIRRFVANAKQRKGVEHLFYFKLGSALRDICSKSKDQSKSVMPAETNLSRPLDIAVHEEALNGVGLGYSRFLHIFL